MTTNIDALIHQVGETIQREASVRTVFGEPIKLDQHTLVPIALVTVTFGGGAGAGGILAQKLLGKAPEAAENPGWTGGGAGGGLSIVTVPVGFLSEKNGDVVFTPVARSAKELDPETARNPAVRRFFERFSGGA
jgi:uncharacterized spore protein YtfJ